MKSFEILQEFPKYDTKTKKKCCWKNGADGYTQCCVARNLETVKIAISLKHNKAKHNKMKCTYVQDKMRN